MNQASRGFTRDMPIMLKGVGIPMMLWHHLFSKSRIDKYVIAFYPLTASQAIHIRGFCKICVTMFAFVSGYGLYQTYKKKSSREGDGHWIIRRYLKGFLPFWFIYVLAYIACMLIDGRPKAIYFKDNLYTGIFYVLFDFLGLATVFQSPMLNGSWWYMSAYFLFIVLFPLLYRAIEKYGSLFLVLLALAFPRLVQFEPGSTDLYSFIPSIVLGMVFNKEQLFEKISAATENKKVKLPVIVVLTGLSFFLYKVSVLMQDKRFHVLIWNYFPIAFIILFHLVIPYLHITQKILKLIGYHATNIFMLHSFIYSIYLEDFIYTRGHFVLIILTLLLMSLALSYCVEGLKKLVRFPTLVKKIDTYFAID